MDLKREDLVKLGENVVKELNEIYKGAPYNIRGDLVDVDGVDYLYIRIDCPPFLTNFNDEACRVLRKYSIINEIVCAEVNPICSSIGVHLIPKEKCGDCCCLDNTI